MDSYDYIIVGAGSAGCVLANRLSENPANTVLLIEAGGKDSHPFLHIPAGFSFMIGNPKADWQYTSQAEPHLNNREIYCPRGRTLGGSSSINGMAYVRGHCPDYDGWRQMGNRGWGWDDVLPYFRKSEDYDGGEDATHGTGGPLAVGHNSLWHPLSEVLVEAASQAGIPRCQDINAGDPDGLSAMPVNLRNGRRRSAATSFLKPVMSRPNLQVETQALVDRIELSEGTATGITYRKNGESRTANARREVIVSAGAVNSPKLLELSGIGDGERLQGIGIPVVRNLPGVGENMQDHLMVSVRQRMKNIRSMNEETHGLHMLKNVLTYLLFQSGMLASSAAQVTGYTKVRPQSVSGDIQFFGIAATFDASGARKFGLEDRPGFTLGFYPCRPESRGHVHAASADPDATPIIQANYLAEAVDQETMVAGLRTCRRIFEQSAFDDYRGEELAPGPNVESDADLLAYVREAADSAYHTSGTCKMGDDSMAVVDDRLRVHGIRALRVVDTSIMPRLVSGNTHAATVMIAEKASDMIQEDQRA